jgi:diacylglycerol kinase (ATP)
MKYGIIVNPVSGKLSIDKKRRKLRKVSKVLGDDCVVGGFDTESKEQFCTCAGDLAEKAEVLIVAGGDGTVSDIINAVDSEVVLSYLPFGSGCALRYALNMPFGLKKIAEQIRDGKQHSLDLISCNNSRKAFMTSIGLEAAILQERRDLQKFGIKGPPAYAIATIHQILTDYKRAETTINIDGQTYNVPNALTTIITKIPYYGYRMKIVPHAEFGDGHLHLLAINASQADVIRGVINSFRSERGIAKFLTGKTIPDDSFISKKAIRRLFINEGLLGEYKKGTSIKVSTKEERYLQTDGDLYRTGMEFRFEVLPGALKMRY